jgi:hypothetical protein
MLPLFPLFLFLEGLRTVIFDIVEYIIMEWTMPNESRMKVEYAEYAGATRRLLSRGREQEAKVIKFQCVYFLSFEVNYIDVVMTCCSG